MLFQPPGLVQRLAEFFLPVSTHQASLLFSHESRSDTIRLNIGFPGLLSSLSRQK